MALKVWRSSNKGYVEIQVNNDIEAMRKIDILSRADLLDNSIQWNAFGLLEYQDGEWSEWYNDNGDSIMDVLLSESELS